MGDLVEELLLLARLDAGNSTPGAVASRRDVDLTSMVVDAAMDARAAGTRHRWSLDVDDDPVVVSGDLAQLRRVVVNLLTNARIHTPENTCVSVAIHREAGPSQRAGNAVFTVQNDGPVIPEDVLAHLFERFTRGDSSRSRETGSTGLGLAIVKAVLDAHGGSIHVSSVPASTVFTVRIPLGPREGKTAR
jgi:two-component system OmpR family sensor kinase